MCLTDEGSVITSSEQLLSRSPMNPITRASWRCFPSFHTSDFYRTLFTAIMPIPATAWYAAIWVLAEELAPSPVKQRCLHQRYITRQWGQSRGVFFLALKNTRRYHVNVSLPCSSKPSHRWAVFSKVLQILWTVKLALFKTQTSHHQRQNHMFIYKAAQCAINPQQAILILHLWIVQSWRSAVFLIRSCCLDQQLSWCIWNRHSIY